MRLRGIAVAATTLLLLATAALAQAQDVRAIQIREAQRTDERTIAYYGRFRAALTEKYANDPLLSMRCSVKTKAPPSCTQPQARPRSS